jgi:hypothetical protein
MRYCIAPLLAALVLSAAVVAPALAAPPSLTGMYVKEAIPDNAPKVRTDPAPLTPAARAAQTRDRNILAASGLVTSIAHTKCLPPGMPDMMQPPFGLEFIESPGRVTVIAEVSNMPRTIYMDMKTHPEGIDPGWNGHSIGHWEGQSLIVDTIGFNGRTPNVSEKMHMIENISLDNGGKTLVDQITMDDPLTYTKPYTITYRYTKLAQSEPLMEYYCEVLPEALAALTAAEKAADATTAQAAK